MTVGQGRRGDRLKDNVIACTDRLVFSLSSLKQGGEGMKARLRNWFALQAIALRNGGGRGLTLRDGRT
jgi:hypothetical protein